MLNIGLSGHGKKHPINAIVTVDAHVAATYFQFHRQKFLTVIVLGGKAFTLAVAVGTFIVAFFLLFNNIPPSIHFPEGIVDQLKFFLKVQLLGLLGNISHQFREQGSGCISG